ncbi:gag/pol protein [Cucumis melo var. makuwa]|uniref:Gag/pol protein n=1 Tax=Cucumis melo var. makuwa TaxID=1194695 RepID=A0A5D3CMF7_CUCMM|nr:gag/pol protein [Cucumis melo var. makuwa]TYK11606.1 gag/pol protein [Cucumis melo var. makuwa]
MGLLRNCLKYLVEKKAEKETQENSYWKKLSEGEITLKVGTGEMVSAEAVGDLKLYFEDRFVILNNVLIGRLVKRGFLSQLEDNSLPPYESCLKEKMTKRSFTKKGLRAKGPLELVHSDLCGPMNVKAQGRYGIHLSKEQCPKTPQEVEDMRNIPYASDVGSLMYAMLCTKPDICYSVGMVSRRTKDYMLVYDIKDMILTRYTDSDLQIDKDARKYTSGSVFTLNGGVVVWRGVKQTCIADSTMEAEYVAAYETVWLRKFLIDLEVVPNMHLPITLYCDNKCYSCKFTKT